MVMMETRFLRKIPVVFLFPSSLHLSNSFKSWSPLTSIPTEEQKRSQYLRERNQMGNCQAVDAAALVIQYPNGNLERMYWPVTASEVMKMNPGNYVSVIIPLPVSDGGQEIVKGSETIRFTRVKLLRPSDILVLGRAYRLVTTQEVMRVLRAKKQAKSKKQAEWKDKLSINSDTKSTNCMSDAEILASEKSNDQATKLDRHQRRSGSTNLITGRPKSWQPSLQSISEYGS